VIFGMSGLGSNDRREIQRRTRESGMRVVVVAAVAVVVLAAGASGATADIPYLSPGTTVVITGSHVGCTVA
jgi:hypothetical protein